MAEQVILQNYTLSYDSLSQGFPSFYSYHPDWMIGMNNFFYTFNGGNVYRHNTNESRNQYYGTNYSSTMTSVFNEIPLKNKLFKTINLETDSPWSATLTSDQQNTGYIETDWFKKKEGAYFAFVRNSGTVPAELNEYALRSLNGIGTSTNRVVNANSTTISFTNTLYIGNIISVGDMVYFGSPTPQLAGKVTEVNQNLPSGINDIVIDNSIAGAVPLPTTQEYILYIKNAVSESHGILGHFGIFKLVNSDIFKVELFAVESEIMKSFP